MFTMICGVILMTILFLFNLDTAPMFVSSTLGIIGVILIIISIKRKSTQQFYFNYIDLLSAALIIVVATLVGIALFGTDLHLAYINIDPAAHYYMAQNNLVNGEHSGMYFNEVNNALIINGLSLFTDSDFTNYKLYLLTDVGMLAFSGLMLYTLITEFAKSKFQSGICAIIAIFYMLGYSLNNMIFGFGYLGTATTLICFLIIVCKLFWDQKICFKFFAPLISMGLLCVALCYMLFAPVIWLTIAIIIFIYCRRNKISIKKTTLIEISIFIIPLILAIKFCFFDFFLAEISGISNQLRANGGLYPNNFANFLLFIPAAIFAFYQNFRKKQSFVTTLFVLTWLLFVILSIIAKHFGFISPYYCAKTYYVMWLMAFLIFTDGIFQLANKHFNLLATYSVIILPQIIGLSFINGNALMDVFEYNFKWIRAHSIISNEVISGYQFAKDNIVNQGEKITWLTNLNQYDRAFWFYSMQAINTNECNYCRAWDYNQQDLITVLTESNVKYVGIYKYDPSSYAPYQTIIDTDDIVFESTDVAIYKLPS